MFWQIFCLGLVAAGTGVLGGFLCSQRVSTGPQDDRPGPRSGPQSEVLAALARALSPLWTLGGATGTSSRPEARSRARRTRCEPRNSRAFHAGLGFRLATSGRPGRPSKARFFSGESPAVLPGDGSRTPFVFRIHQVSILSPKGLSVFVPHRSPPPPLAPVSVRIHWP